MVRVPLDSVERSLASTHWQRRFLDEATCPPDLATALAAAGIEWNSLASELPGGSVYVNGRPVFANTPLIPPVQIDLYLPKAEIRESPPFDARHIVYEDDHLIVVFKPSGAPSVPSRDRQLGSVRESLELFLNSKVHVPSRLDVAAQGLMVASKSPEAHRNLQRAFEQRQVKKTYLMEVSGHPDWQERQVEVGIARHPLHPVLRVASHTEGQAASSSFRVMRCLPGPRALLVAHPHTGRTHQLRVHAAFLRHPIIGDPFYGMSSDQQQLRLACFRLNFAHPVFAHEVEVSLPRRLQFGWLKAATALS